MPKTHASRDDSFIFGACGAVMVAVMPVALNTEGIAELRVAVSDEVGEAVAGGFEVGGEVPGQLGSRTSGRVPGDGWAELSNEGVSPTRASPNGNWYQGRMYLEGHK